MILAGIDEAGYGPLLGPLVVSATAFEVDGTLVPDEPDAIPDLWRLLKEAVARKAAGAKGRIVIADSKAIHPLTDGDKILERGALAMLRATMATGTPPETTQLTAMNILPLLGCRDHDLPKHPWYAAYNPELPSLCEAGDLAIATNVLLAAMRKAAVRPVLMHTALVSERAFNSLVAVTNNKASALVSFTLSHVYHLHRTFGQRGLVITIDKQGGRDHYTTLLLQAFPEAKLRVIREAGESSAYLLTETAGSAERRTLLNFRPKGETHSLPTALASMICKYLRELFMRGFNTWWCTQIPQLRPTAGYHEDGMRWLGDVEPHLQRLGVAREQLVRSR